MELEDLTPISLSEIEKFLFITRRIYFEDLEYSLKRDLEDHLVRALSYMDCAEKDLKISVDRFNMIVMPKYIKGNFLVGAQVGYKVKCIDPLSVDLWVDYHGILSTEVDKLPRPLKRQMMDKYLEGWRGIVQDPLNNQNLITLLKNALIDEFSCSKIIDLYVAPRAEKALLNTGIIDQVKCVWQGSIKTLGIKAQLTGQIEPVNFKAIIL